jgi:hypothetical protein
MRLRVQFCHLLLPEVIFHAILFIYWVTCMWEALTSISKTLACVSKMLIVFCVTEYLSGPLTHNLWLVTCDPQYFKEWQFTLQFTKWVVWSIETNKLGTASIMGEWEPLASNWASLELLLQYLFLVKITFDKSKTINRSDL